MNIKINKLQHIGIPVVDLKASEIFYEGLGFTNVMHSHFEIEGIKGFVSMMQQHDIIIELYQMPPKQLEEIKTRQNGRIDHIAFDVDDIEATFQIMQLNGYTLLEEAPVYLKNFWKKGCAYFNIAGPNGERLEFNQIL